MSMEANKPSVSRLPSFPIIIFNSAVLLTIITFLWTMISMYKVDKQLINTYEQDILLMKLQEQIIHLDELMTMSVHMTVATKDKQWQERYNKYNDELTKSINQALVLAISPRFSEIIQQTDTVNAKLLELESNAFLLASHGKFNDANKILLSGRYQDLKKEYAEYTNFLTSTLDRHIQADRDYLNKIHIVSVSIVSICFIVLILAWYITVKKILFWKYELERKIQSELQYKIEIESARHFLNEILMINKMSDRLQTCQTPSDAYSIVAHTAKELFSGLSGGLCIRQPVTDEIETVQSWGDSQYLKRSFSSDECWALKNSHIYIVNEIKNGIVCQHFQPIQDCNYMCIPLIVQNGSIGLLELNAAKNEIISDHQQKIATTFCDVLRLGLGNIFLRVALSDQATHDALTGLYNRRHLDKSLTLLLRNSIHNNKKLCVAILDLDHFKKINDDHGHEAGDEVLKFVGNLLRKSLRVNDSAYRFGGEEFLITMEASLSDAIPRLKQISDILNSTHIPYQSDNLPIITISMGIVEVPVRSISPYEIIRLADEALYKAKSLGRNRIEVATIEEM